MFNRSKVIVIENRRGKNVPLSNSSRIERQTVRGDETVNVGKRLFQSRVKIGFIKIQPRVSTNRALNNRALEPENKEVI